ncbi:hypothetical protein P171DRAFT_99607 [Karstenula rhodostoma CBS 690.94]|uniref:Uncharacterized protein n=1 Tax=Karstenula rhodostoma CBS 690.94 TaxID=1392251 RepID=A0A9P4PBW7_9PLEO|nr:hypothetical protein P171DRAFT_99607 [Karstenula rhodostoma CBS 690.94]
MTDYMTQPGLSLPPSSRQDIVSALLNDYGNSFEDGDSSTYETSQVAAFKELPPPPPERARAGDYDDGKASLGVQKMNMPFQLRVDIPISPESPNGSSTSDGSPSRIVSQRLKRRSIPRSLTLTRSNGSTAELPNAPAIASHPVPQDPFHTPIEEKALPPPPPEKSTRRQQSAMGNQSSTARSPRKDSLHSQDGKDDMEPVRRKPLPKFTSLADLGNGPRGGKGGPLPQPRARKQSLETDAEENRGRTVVRTSTAEQLPRESAPPKLREQTAPMDVPRMANPLPPTPKDEPVAGPPPSSKKPFGGMGLPSNPKHRKGKSDTRFDVLNSATSPRAQQLPAPPQTMTPGPTPTPRKTETMGNEKSVDHAARLSPEESNSQLRPFSFERVPTSAQLKQSTREPSSDASINAPPPASHPQPQPPSPPSPPASHTPLSPASPPRSPPRHQPPPPAFASLPSQRRSPTSDPAMSSDSSPATPPFVPLTDTPAPVSGAPITHKHHACYSQHATFVWSRNDFQPMACMICAKNDSDRRWACVWCYLRICAECSVELQKEPGRRLQGVLERRAAAAGDAYEDDEEPMHPGFEGDANGAVNGGAGVSAGVNGKKHDSGTANPSFVVWDADAEGVGERVGF